MELGDGFLLAHIAVVKILWKLILSFAEVAERYTRYFEVVVRETS